MLFSHCSPSSPPAPRHYRIDSCGGVGQLLAEMIAEPALLSEYTIFALDNSKRPRAAQVPSVVSLSSHVAFSSSPLEKNKPDKPAAPSSRPVSDAFVGYGLEEVCLQLLFLTRSLVALFPA